MLCLNRKINQAIQINDDITITVLEIKRGSVRLGITYGEKNRVLRHEIYVKVESENKGAALSLPDVLKNIEKASAKPMFIPKMTHESEEKEGE
jgi:carbon storage regulator